MPPPPPTANPPRSASSASPPSNPLSPATSTPSLVTAYTPRKDSPLGPSPSVSHRSSFADNLRNYPPSPRAQRHPSFSGAALTELLMQPSSKAATAAAAADGGGDARFQGRDWRAVQLHEIVDPAEVRFVELDTSIEDTTKLLVRSGAPNVVLVRESRKTRTAIGTFGYDDLNAYLLLVLGMAQKVDERAAWVVEQARNGEVLPLKDIKDHLGPGEEPAFLPHTADLTKAVEILGSGTHRIVVCKEGTSEAVGVLSQLRLVRFFWENHTSFAATEALYSRTLQELKIGAKEVVAINGDRPLSDALRLMHDEGITSLPVLDNHRNVVGNISHVDVRLLTDTSSIPLLSSSCIHFISVILSQRGVEDGKDAYPVFHVHPYSTLAHTVAKLCATRSHRMWIVDTPSPSTSVPPSPKAVHAPPAINTPSTPIPATAVSASQLPGANLSGRLSGVVSLTDALNVLARASGLSPADPEETRRRRRRSSSSTSASSSSRPHLDIGAATGTATSGTPVRASAEVIRESIELARSGSRGRSGSAGSARR